MNTFVEKLAKINASDRVKKLRKTMLDEPRYLSLEQAKYITQAYKENEEKSVILKRAYALKLAMEKIEIVIEDGELICGNRTKQSCSGVVFPEGGLNWLENEIDALPTRAQDKFKVREEDKDYFFKELIPYWKGKTLEDKVNEALSKNIKICEIVGKLNQKDHAQGHICPRVEQWISKGPLLLMQEAKEKLKTATKDQQELYEALILCMEGAIIFINRYANLAKDLMSTCADKAAIEEVIKNCENLAKRPASNFSEAVQAVWFLFVLIQLESNASSFSPGRIDQYLLKYYKEDKKAGIITEEKALELIDCLFIKFNQIVYMRSSGGAEFFAGFPIGFNMTLGGKKPDGSSGINELTYIFLRAQEHMYLRQPNLSARLYDGAPELYLTRVAKVIGRGSGMPQVVNDESIVSSLQNIGISEEDAKDYAIIGCVEISTQGNNLGFSDAAMFNMVKVLELTLNNGKCLLTGKQIGIDTGNINDYKTYEELEKSYTKQLDYYTNVMIQGLEIIEEKHKLMMPSPFLSSVIDCCMEKGLDVTAGGAKYNYSGIQIIQIANLADCFAALKTLMYDNKNVTSEAILSNMQDNFKDEVFRLRLLNSAPKYGNDIEWVDNIALKWVEYMSKLLSQYTNFRGGKYHIGLYTVSAHVPMGKNVGASPDGRRSGEPLADGGMSAVYGRDKNGPTALLKSVSRVDSKLASNGSLLNLKFNPQVFETSEGVQKFVSILKTFVKLKIHHAQFNVITREDLIAAQKEPEKHRNLLIRVAGYSANFVELSEKLQNEILDRTEYGF